MEYLYPVLTQIIIFIILASSYNLVLGYTGMIHVGHIAFMAIGAYTSALLTLHQGTPFLLALLAAMVVSGIIGLLLAIPTIRFRDDYIVAATFGMSEIIRITLLNEREFTGGSSGVNNIPRPELFGINFDNNLSLLLFVALVALIVMLFIYRLVHSPFAKVLESIREDEIAAKSLGKNTNLVKLQVLVIAAIIAGLSGALYAHANQYIDPDTFNIQRISFIFLIVVFGGSGTFWGPVVGTTILYTILEGTRFLDIPDHIIGPLRWIIYSVILIAVIIYKPTGIMGKKLIRKKL